MNIVNNLIVQGLFSIVLGVALIVWPEQAIHYLMIAIGIFFLLPGILSLFSYFLKEKTLRPSFPIEAVGSILLGVVLLLFPLFYQYSDVFTWNFWR
jgi:hypothetical protein